MPPHLLHRESNLGIDWRQDLSSSSTARRHNRQTFLKDAVFCHSFSSLEVVVNIFSTLEANVKHFFQRACGRATLLIIFVFLLLPIGSALAQELIPDSIYFYYGRQMTLEEVNHIASERFSRTGAYTDCVYVPSSD